MTDTLRSPLANPLTLPCGGVLKNRIAKAAMSNSLVMVLATQPTIRSGFTNDGPRVVSHCQSSVKSKARLILRRSPGT